MRYVENLICDNMTVIMRNKCLNYLNPVQSLFPGDTAMQDLQCGVYVRVVAFSSLMLSMLIYFLPVDK